MLMIILIIIFFIIPHFDEVKFRSTIYIPELGEIYKNGDFTWMVSDCEELVGAQEMMGLVLGNYLVKTLVYLFIWHSCLNQTFDQNFLDDGWGNFFIITNVFDIWSLFLILRQKVFGFLHSI